MTKKQTQLTRRENAKAIARWEDEGGARKSPSAEERDSRNARVDYMNDAARALVGADRSEVTSRRSRLA